MSMVKTEPSQESATPRRPVKKRITDEEWVKHKHQISRLYLDEGKDVKDVRDTMKRHYHFEAHEKAYKRKFEEWGLTKNVPKDEGLFMVKKREERRHEGKNTIFWRRRRQEGPLQLVPDDKVDRIADRYSHDLNSVNSVQARTPENIEYQTPDDFSYSRQAGSSKRSAPNEYPFPAANTTAGNAPAPPAMNGPPPLHGMAAPMVTLPTLPSIAHHSSAMTQSMMPNGISAAAGQSVANGGAHAHHNGHQHASHQQQQHHHHHQQQQQQQQPQPPAPQHQHHHYYSQQQQPPHQPQPHHADSTHTASSFLGSHQPQAAHSSSWDPWAGRYY